MPVGRRSRHLRWVLLGWVVADVALLLGLGGFAGSLAQHERVLDDDTLRACIAAVVGGGESWGYAVDGEPVFDGPNTITADLRRTTGADGPSRDGRMRCTVSAGEEIDDPMIVERAVLTP